MAVPQTGKESLIVALDVPTVNEALAVVDKLDNVSFFKLGLQLFMSGGIPELLDALREKSLFVDLKLPGDIGNTIGAVVDICVDKGVKFLTLSDLMPLVIMSSAMLSRNKRGSENPKFLTVPFLSSLDRDDLRQIGEGDDIDAFVLRRARNALQAGCDGVIASGQAIRPCRNGLPPSTIIVSPGIRPVGSSTDDHKRFTTPRQAVLWGADYLVVGRPILKSEHPRDTAEAIISEIDKAIKEKNTPTSHGGEADYGHPQSLAEAPHISG